MLRYLDTAAESARLIMNNAYRAAQLIHSFKQIAVDQTSEARRPFALMAYMDEIVTSLRPKLKGTQIVAAPAIRQRRLAPTDIMLDSYPGAFAQVLTNLLLNCVEHAFGPDQGGRIERARPPARRHGGNGSGRQWRAASPPDIIDRIFDPFFTTRRGQGGTGLGLNIVYNLVVKQFDGSITARSTLGQGTRFLLRIPRVTPQAGEGGAAASEEKGAALH